MKAGTARRPCNRMEDRVTSAVALWKTGDDAYSRMAGTLFSYWSCWTVSAIADLSIADHLAAGSLTAQETDGRFGSTPLLATLRTDDPKSLRPFVQSLMGAWLPWHQFSTGIREGNTPFTKAHGGSFFDYFTAHPDEAELFAEAMTSFIG